MGVTNMLENPLDIRHPLDFNTWVLDLEPFQPQCVDLQRVPSILKHTAMPHEELLFLLTIYNSEVNSEEEEEDEGPIGNTNWVDGD